MSEGKKIILRGVKIFGFDPEVFRTYENGAKVTKQYSVALYVTPEDKELIDSFLFNKVSQNEDGDNIFYGKSKQPIPVFDSAKNRIMKPLNEVFIADVSILIDEFTDAVKAETVRYSKCLGIKYVRKVENEQPKIPAKVYTDFDDIFSDETELFIPATPEPAPVATQVEQPVMFTAEVREDGMPF